MKNYDVPCEVKLFKYNLGLFIYRYRPPTRITVTTQMAAPQPMVKPDFYGVVNGEEIQVC